MCGIIGSLGGIGPSSYEFDRMVDALSHRGPDGRGTWRDDEHRIRLGHRLLAITDLTAAARQPMLSTCGRYILVFNGEIYNKHELLRDNQGRGSSHLPNGESDTAALLASISLSGLDRTLAKLEGMFAIAVWDRETRHLTLARDRFGEKPVYYGYIDGEFVFASDLCGLYKHPRWKGEIDRRALSAFMHLNSVPGSASIFKNIYKLSPGKLLRVNSNTRMTEEEIYTSTSGVDKGNNIKAPINYDTLVGELDIKLGDAVKSRMVGKVPMGAFLSGGYDSTAIVSQMQRHSQLGAIKTFSVGLENSSMDESAHALEVSNYLGTDHTNINISVDDVKQAIELMPEVYSEPFADASQIPTYILSCFASKKVKYVLTGDGGDELFAGYNRHIRAEGVWGFINSTPDWIIRLIQLILKMGSSNNSKIFSKVLQSFSDTPDLELKVQKLIYALSAKSEVELYSFLRGHWLERNIVLGSGYNLLDPFVDRKFQIDITRSFARWDMDSYLPDDILVKVDRAAMAAGLETRAPFLDSTLLSFSNNLPTHYLSNGSIGKILLRDLVHRYVPKEIMHRPKMGFGIPLGDWLRGPLRQWAETLLDPELIKKQEYFDPDMVSVAWKMHLDGSRRNEEKLWCLLMFQSWHSFYDKLKIIENDRG